jgi:hypothetical protein
MGASPQFAEATILRFMRKSCNSRHTESDIRAALSIGQISARQALQALTRQGLIQSHPGGRVDANTYSLCDSGEAKPAFRMKELSAQHVPSRDYDRIRPGSGDLLRVPSKHI